MVYRHFYKRRQRLSLALGGINILKKKPRTDAGLNKCLKQKQLVRFTALGCPFLFNQVFSHFQHVQHGYRQYLL